MTKTNVTVSLDAELVVESKKRNMKLSTVLNELLKAELDGETADGSAKIVTWLTDKRSGAKYQNAERGLVFPSKLDMLLYDSVRPKKNRPFRELRAEEKANAASELVERCGNSDQPIGEQQTGEAPAE